MIFYRVHSPHPHPGALLGLGIKAWAWGVGEDVTEGSIYEKKRRETESLTSSASRQEHMGSREEAGAVCPAQH